MNTKHKYALKAKTKKLLDTLLDGTISKSDYSDKKIEMDDELAYLYSQMNVLQASTIDEKQVSQRSEGFKRALLSNETLTAFDKSVF
ncbi:MAG: hypothetical protein WBJ13_07515 [Sedimentibacter sp.]